MTKGVGKPICPGIAVGKIFLMHPQNAEFSHTCEDVPSEQRKFEEALQTARLQLQALVEKVKTEFGDSEAEMIEVQLLMLEDLDFLEGVSHLISSGKSAAFAVTCCAEQHAAALAALDNEYMRARAADVTDVSKRLTDILCGVKHPLLPTEPFILLAEELSPAETAALPRNLILAIVISQGAPNSHTAILARILGVPALIQSHISLDDTLHGQTMAVDAMSGEYYISPSLQILRSLQQKQLQWQQSSKALDVYRHGPTVTKFGRKISLYANVSCVEDVDAALQNGAEGIGLLRSEFLYFGRSTLPAEEELLEAYRSVAQKMGGKEVVIRTLDMGSDKQAPCLPLPAEQNPALGCRGVRVCLNHPNMFLTQLRAIYRASVYGNLAVMFPMICSLKEVAQIKNLCAQAQEELTNEGVPVRKIPHGIMIETPAAAVISDVLAKEVDFFSVGTNDLIQYTLAADRQSPWWNDHDNAHHPAVLRLLKTIALNAHQAEIWTGICGELAAEPSVLPALLQYGFDELSAAPSKIPEIRKLILESEV